MSNTVLKPKVEPCSSHFVNLLKLTFVKVVYFICCFHVKDVFIKAVYPSHALLNYHALRELPSTGTVCLTVITVIDPSSELVSLRMVLLNIERDAINLSYPFS